MVLEDWVYLYIPTVFCALAFLVNPVFVYFIFTEQKSRFGNYRYLLLFFAVFNLIYSVVNVIVPLDIHSYRYCFFLITKHGWFVENTELNFQMMIARCSLICYFPGRANVEIRQYIREDFNQTYGANSMDFNMLGALFNEGSDETKIRSWIAVMLWTAVSTASIIMFLILARMICYFPGRFNVGIRDYIREEFNETYVADSTDFNLLRALFNEGSDQDTVLNGRNAVDLSFYGFK
ncbi:hypothetical protein CAEBREN_05136 [Caenorhabditis brenneri]|uniref:Uncharacterized protein n=1 Tax=Caenorhabditis brenneri TaxID=135651 RepID=G0NHT9_CAEBE|nr:hypothetical protein CAEBREN_05136 [Caenorhabditis brenneri]